MMGITTYKEESLMASILYIGMDVHTTNFSVCAYRIGNEEVFGETNFTASSENIAAYLDTLRYNEEDPEKIKFICGYEAGCLGYSLYRELKAKGIDCRILAPSTMAMSPLDSRKKNDRMDAQRIAKCLAFGTYRPVYVPDEQDDAVKEYIRMRDDANAELKRVKQQITTFCIRHSKLYDGVKHKWTKEHRTWLKKLKFENAVLREVLDEYLLRLQQIEEKIATYAKRIEEFANTERYAETVKKMGCLKGIATHTALSMAAEIGDFRRFPTAQHFSSYLGLTPGEHSSGNSQHTLGITKAGNSHLRSLLVEAAQCYNRGAVGQKSAALKARQAGNSEAIIQYADRANERLRRKYVRMTMRSSSNVAKTAIARELACFIWGIMTDHIS
jgi:transposase